MNSGESGLFVVLVFILELACQRPILQRFLPASAFLVEASLFLAQTKSALRLRKMMVFARNFH
jgi:hypothetical protein